VLDRQPFAEATFRLFESATCVSFYNDDGSRLQLTVYMRCLTRSNQETRVRDTIGTRYAISWLALSGAMHSPHAMTWHVPLLRTPVHDGNQTSIILRGVSTKPAAFSILHL
jgi:hypothetical protein